MSPSQVKSSKYCPHSAARHPVTNTSLSTKPARTPIAGSYLGKYDFSQNHKFYLSQTIISMARTILLKQSTGFEPKTNTASLKPRNYYFSKNDPPQIRLPKSSTSSCSPNSFPAIGVLAGLIEGRCSELDPGFCRANSGRPSPGNICCYLPDLVTPTFKTPSLFDSFSLELHLS